MTHKYPHLHPFNLTQQCRHHLPVHRSRLLPSRLLRANDRITDCDIHSGDIPSLYLQAILILTGASSLLVVRLLFAYAWVSCMHGVAHVLWYVSQHMYAAADNVIKVWLPFTGELIRNLSGHTKGLSDISWLSDGTYLASASDDTSIQIWNVETVRCLYYPCIAHGNDGWASQGSTTKHLRGHTSFVFCVNYNTASTLLVSGGCKGDVRICNFARGALSCGLPFGARILIGH